MACRANALWQMNWPVQVPGRRTLPGPSTWPKIGDAIAHDAGGDSMGGPTRERQMGVQDREPGFTRAMRRHFPSPVERMLGESLTGVR